MSQPGSRTSLYMAALFCLLFVSTNFVNKYVLSILQFTYPTIFQGWQTLVGAFVLKMLTSAGKMEPLLKEVDRRSVAPWIPGMMLFLASIYSGSRALTNLPVPVFFTMQNTTLLFKVTIRIVQHRQLLSCFSYFMLMTSLLSAVGVSLTDPQFSMEGYFWMAVHVLSTGFFHLYTSVVKGKLKLDALDRLYTCYLYSVVMLAPCSYLLGDALEAVKYPYLYFTKFYLGCIFSGVLGIFLNLSTIRLQDSDFLPSGIDFTAIQAIARIGGSFLSLFIFDTILTSNFAFLLAVNQLCSVAVSDAISHRPLPHVILSAVSSRHQVSVPDVQHLERHELQRDMLRIEIT